ncbi:MAG TPA: NAD(P)H-dependent oxidoreductase subunit E, partial [Gammaproteobacteria bacterium]|nr:NAD(P)H-dependent oxidoreductase subunit E [Gammaproteobacteria bacterium]
MTDMAETKSHALSAHAREEIDRWVAQYPEGRQRSAVIEALR